MLIPARSQNKSGLLERTVTITLTEERLDVALKKIGQQAGLTFSYRSSLVEEKRRVSFDFQNKTIRQILDEIFQGKLQYKERGKYIILTKPTKTASSEPAKVSGYIVDEATGQRLKNVSVYDPVSLSSVITDSEGYFELEVKKPSGDDIKLAINKNNYTDTLVVVPARNGGIVNIPLRIDKDKLNTIVDSVGVKLKRAWLATKRATVHAVNMENISDTIRRDFQFSVIPFVGTNGALSGNVINDLSLNLFAGYSLGVKTLEIAGWANATRGDMEGVQIAGLANGVMGKNKGVQLAGLGNVLMDSSLGPQIAGLANVNFKYAEKFQLAGLMNYTHGDSRGFIGAGLFNFNLGKQLGPAFAGLFNFSVSDASPIQMGGLFNFTAGSMRGVQAAGLFNYANDEVRGSQIAGLFNVAPKDVYGVQVAPFNVAKHVEGSQVGVLNISKSTKGIPVGVISIVGKGYHKIEISADEVFYTNLAFRTGVRQFYNILTAGANPATFSKDSTLWTFGYGIGTAPKLSETLSLNVDVIANQIVNGNSLDDLNMVNKLYVGVDYELSKGLSLIAGVTLNAHFKERSSEYSDIFADYRPSPFYERDIGSKNEVAMWFGGKLGLRFL